tara:strand:- start:831 stop:1124 length:294 start_codon:yes stop_codon:yes gene_type:complete
MGNSDRKVLMSLNRYAKNRDTNEREIVDGLRAIGARVVQIDRPVDLLVGYRRRTFLLEVKSGRGRLTPLQVEFFEAWSGGTAVVVRSLEEAIDVVTG